MEKLICKAKDGYFEAKVSSDSNYPGIRISFVPNNPEDEGLFGMELLFEKPNDTGELRLLVWNDKDKEDFQQEIFFK